jgi:hypothetical protein
MRKETIMTLSLMTPRLPRTALLAGGLALLLASGAAAAPRLPVSGGGWYHFPGSENHFPSKGYLSADDTYALDLNLAGDEGQTVVAIESGVVRQLDRACWGWVLVEHTGALTWQGKTYSRWYSGYLHMKNLPTSIAVGVTVSQGTKIGEVSGSGRKDGTCSTTVYSSHLHFAVYVGKPASSTDNGTLESVDPGRTIGLTDFTYGDMTTGGAIFNETVDNLASAGGALEVAGPRADWYESPLYGLREGTYYTRNASTTPENWAYWRATNPIPASTTNCANAATDCYTVYAFVPSNYATTTAARYVVIRNGVDVLGSKVVNQATVANQWVALGRYNLARGARITVYLEDKTGEANRSRYVAFDAIKVFRKVDRRMEMKTTPVLTSPAAGSTLGGSSATFAWKTGSGVSSYWLYVGSAPGSWDLYNSGQLAPTTLSRPVSGLPTDGRTLYVRLWWLADGGWSYADTPCRAASTGGRAALVGPAPGSTLRGSSATFSWTAGSGVTAYWLYAGNAPGSADIYNSNQLSATTLSRAVSGLPTDGRTLYVRLWWFANGAWSYADYSYRTGR